MHEFQIAVFPGDGIGREVMTPCLQLLQEAVRRAGGVRLVVTEYEAGANLYSRTGESLPEEAMAAAASAHAILLGAMGLPNVRYPDGTEVAPQIDFREKFELYAGVRPVRAVSGVPVPLADPRSRKVDFVIVRESTEGMFAARRLHRREGDVAFDTTQISRNVSERLFRFSFDLARRRRSRGLPGRVACVDKANVLPAMAYFREIFLEVAAEYPDVETECVYVDAAGLRLVRAPWTFDVIVTENMFGDILSDVAAALIGGLGMAPSADIGDQHAVFQPCHGTAPDIAGKGLANPAAMFLSAAMMLEWLGERHDAPQCGRAAVELAEAVDEAFAQGDLNGVENGGAAGTEAVAAGVRKALDRRPVQAAQQ